jgi:alkylated DNA repair dioxygenase AlkB
MSSSSKQTQLTSYFQAIEKKDTNWKLASTPKPSPKPSPAPTPKVGNALAESLGTKLHSKPKYITKDGTTSWYILVKQYMKPKSKKEFDLEWSKHPLQRKQIRIFGKMVFENRWSQAHGISMSYSGLEQIAKPITKIEDEKDCNSGMVLPTLIDEINRLMETSHQDTSISQAEASAQNQLYNACLQNWYTPDDSMGLHSDDESYLKRGLPIFSLSWGGARRFLFRSKTKCSESYEKIELWLEDGDLLVMGGLCQETHKHGIPKLRCTMDPPTSNRINWTVRALKE